MNLMHFHSFINTNSLWRVALNDYSKGPFEIVMVFIITIGVFFLAWLAARFLAKRSMQPRRNGLMHMADRLMLGKDKQIVLLKVGQVYYLVGLSQNSIQFSQPVKPEAFAEVFADKQKAGDLFEQKTDCPLSQNSEPIIPSGDRAQAGAGSRFMDHEQYFSDRGHSSRSDRNNNHYTLIENAVAWLINAFRWKNRWQAMKQQQPRQNRF